MFGYTTLWFIINIFIKHISDWHHSSDIHISQGSVATCLRRDGIFKHSFVANLSLRLPAKEFWKSVNIWWSYRQESGVLFFDSQYRSVFTNRWLKPQEDVWSSRNQIRWLWSPSTTGSTAIRRKYVIWRVTWYAGNVVRTRQCSRLHSRTFSSCV